ncbi:MAG: cupin domain-containing protein [Streptosporangiaceae bacterium]
MTAAITRKTDIHPQQTRSGAVARVMLDAAGAGGHLVRRLVDVEPDSGHAGTAGAGGELWFVIAGTADLEVDGAVVRAGPSQGVRVPGGADYRLRPAGREPVELDVVSLPGPLVHADGPDAEAGPAVVDLDDCEVETTGNRRFRVLFGPGRGCAAATQFVGEIPPGRAPVHSHAYDEVVLILAGQGVVHAGQDHPLAAGSCVHLAPGQPHCLENTGPEPLIVLGVFHPGGSPAQKQQKEPKEQKEPKAQREQR